MTQAEIEHQIRKYLDGAADPARAASGLLGFVSARLTLAVGAQDCGVVLYALADTAATHRPVRP